jgi:hypothetical protein
MACAILEASEEQSLFQASLNYVLSARGLAMGDGQVVVACFVYAMSLRDQGRHRCDGTGS